MEESKVKAEFVANYLSPLLRAAGQPQNQKEALKNGYKTS